VDKHPFLAAGQGSWARRGVYIRHLRGHVPWQGKVRQGEAGSYSYPTARDGVPVRNGRRRRSDNGDKKDKEATEATEAMTTRPRLQVRVSDDSDDAEGMTGRPA